MTIKKQVTVSIEISDGDLAAFIAEADPLTLVFLMKCALGRLTKQGIDRIREFMGSNLKAEDSNLLTCLEHIIQGQ